MAAGRSAWLALDAWETNHYRMINWGENLAPTPLEFADDSIVQKYQELVSKIKKIID